MIGMVFIVRRQHTNTAVVVSGVISWLVRVLIPSSLRVSISMYVWEYLAAVRFQFGTAETCNFFILHYLRRFVWIRFCRGRDYWFCFPSHREYRTKMVRLIINGRRASLLGGHHRIPL